MFSVVLGLAGILPQMKPDKAWSALKESCGFTLQAED